MMECWIIGANIFRQLMRNRILVVLSLFALALVGVASFLGDLGQEAEVRLARDFGLLAIEWVGFFTVLACHVVLLFEETELRTIAILFVKPIRRWQYMIGKVLGSVLLLAMNQAAMVLVLWGISKWRGLEMVEGVFLISALYLFFGCVLFSVVAVFFSIYASTVPACAVYASFAFGLGHFTTNLLDWVERLQRTDLVPAVKVLYYVLPNFSLFNLKDNASALLLSDLKPEALLWPLAYGLAYGTAVLSITLWLYERKEY